jgi:hypothetical protein
MQTTWRLEWTWNSDGTVTLDTAQSDTSASVTTPVEAVGNGLDIALGSRIAVQFPACNRAWLSSQPAFEPPGPLTEQEMRFVVARTINAASGTLTVECGSVATNPTLNVNPAEGSRARLTLFLENLT